MKINAPDLEVLLYWDKILFAVLVRALSGSSIPLSAPLRCLLVKMSDMASFCSMHGCAFVRSNPLDASMACALHNKLSINACQIYPSCSCGSKWMFGSLFISIWMTCNHFKLHFPAHKAHQDEFLKCLRCNTVTASHLVYGLPIFGMEFVSSSYVHSTS